MSFTLSSGNLAPSDLSAVRSDSAAQMQAKAIQNAAKSGDAKALREKAEAFEAQFVSQMLTHMFKGVSTSGLMGGGNAEGIWRDFYVEEVSKGIARQGGIGVADVIERQLLALQEVK